jgi:hypothetical protein
MTLFDLTFSLTALILGLALTHMASAVYKLALAGRRVHWSPEQLLQAIIIFTVIVFVWVSQWESRAVTEIAFWRILLRVVKLLVLYVAAAACFPEASNHEASVDLHTHYETARRITYGALCVSLVLFDIDAWTGSNSFHWSWHLLPAVFQYIGPYVALIFIRTRWVNLLLLSFVLIDWGSSILTYRLTG